MKTNDDAANARGGGGACRACPSTVITNTKAIFKIRANFRPDGGLTVPNRRISVYAAPIQTSSLRKSARSAGVCARP